MKKRNKKMKKFFRKGKGEKLIKAYDNYVKEDIIAATNRGKLLLGLDDDVRFSHPSLVYSMPAVLNKRSAAKLILNKDRVRFDLAHFNALYFDKDTLYYYNTYIDHRLPGNYNDVALELPYKQIKALETSLMFVKVNGRPHHVYELVLKLDGLKDINIPLKMMAYDSKTKADAYLLEENTVQIVKELKAFLRSKMA